MLTGLNSASGKRRASAANTLDAKASRRGIARFVVIVLLVGSIAAVMLPIAPSSSASTGAER